MHSGQPWSPGDLFRWVKENRTRVPNMDRLYDKMASGGSYGHYVHAHYARRLHDCARYRITDIEASTGGHDVDIQLDGWINIQVWHGMNAHGHILAAQLHPGTPQSIDVGQRLGVPTNLGGVPTHLEHDGAKVRKKLAQLPDDTLGILLLHGGPFAYHIPTSPEAIPASKCILNICGRGATSELHCSSAFDHDDEVRNVADCLGLLLVRA